MSTSTDTDRGRKAPLPPRWVIRVAWAIHRAIYALTLGRLGLRRQTPERWGMMRLATVGRRSGRERHAMLGYFEDGPNLVTMAMNGWASPEPKWWLNLQANPNATVELWDGTRREVSAHAATGEERDRLWQAWYVLNEDYEGYTRLRSGETAIVVLEPRAT
jgi:deazaflavin-dependent oxidoreductase (nitroreductase family)